MTELEKLFDTALRNAEDEYDGMVVFDMPEYIKDLEDEINNCNEILNILKEGEEITIAIKEGYEEYKIVSIVNNDNPYIEEYDGVTNGDDVGEFVMEANCRTVASGADECFDKLKDITKENYKVLDNCEIEFDY